MGSASAAGGGSGTFRSGGSDPESTVPNAPTAATQIASFVVQSIADPAKQWGLDFSGEARRGSRARLEGTGAFNSRLTAKAEAWRVQGSLTAFANAGHSHSRDTEGFVDRERFLRAGLEWAGPGRDLWALETGRTRITGRAGTERDLSLSWSTPLLRDWRVGLQAGTVRAPGFRDLDLMLTLRVPL